MKFLFELLFQRHFRLLWKSKSVIKIFLPLFHLTVNVIFFGKYI